MPNSSVSVLFLLGSALAVLIVLHWEELEPIRSAAFRFSGSSSSELAQESASAAVRRLAALLRSRELATSLGKYNDASVPGKHTPFHVEEKDLRTNVEQAETWLKTLQLERQSLRKQRHASSSAASALTRLGSFQAEHGRPNAAIFGLQRAVKIMKKVVVEEDSDSTSDSVSDDKESDLVIAAKAEAALADALCTAGGEKGNRQTQAKAYFGEALQTLNRVKHQGDSGDQSFRVLSAEVHASLAQCLHLNGDLSTAAAMLRVAGVLAKEASTGPSGHHLIPRVARLLGGVRHDEGSTKEAIRLYEQYFDTMPAPTASVSDSPIQFVELFQTLQDHALASASLGHRTQALQALDDVRLLQERLDAELRSSQGPAAFLKDEGHPEVVLSGSLARTWQLHAEILLNSDTSEGFQSRVREAVAASAQAIPILQKLKDAGEGLRQLSDALNTHGNALVAMGRSAQAEAAYRQALNLSQELHGDNNPLTAAMRHNLGTALARQGDYDGALKLFNEALTTLKETLGDNPDVSAVLASIASILRKQGQTQKSCSTMREALRIAEKTLPAGHSSRNQYETIVERWDQQEIDRRGQDDSIFQT